MRIRARYFAFYEDLTGRKEEFLEVPKGATVAEVFEKIVGGHPLKNQLFRATLFSVNQEYAEKSRVLKAGDEVALIPPVSGG